MLFDEFLLASECLSSNEILKHVANITPIYLGCSSAAVYTYNESSNKLYNKAGDGGLKTIGGLSMEDGLIPYCFKNERLINIMNPRTDRRCKHNIDYSPNENVLSILVVPIRNERGKIEGIIETY